MSVAGGEGRRDALLIATDTYDDTSLRSLRSPSQDCTALAAVLADPCIGGFRTEQLKDARAHQAMRAVEQFFRDRSRDDLLLLHISCHGIKDDDGSLYFAALDTDRDLPASTAIPAAFLRDRMNGCRARTIVVLLDCCYSGAFVPGAKGDDQVHVRDELGGHGRVVLTATSRTEYAWEGSGCAPGFRSRPSSPVR
ncbi:caspase family protein [Streptomyces shenzhenensis]|uniref:caspase family protein n=1 Tax=Streptomyces shenzhenensis TaxID=943815 RepID=UPI003D91E813